MAYLWQQLTIHNQDAHDKLKAGLDKNNSIIKVQPPSAKLILAVLKKKWDLVKIEIIRPKIQWRILY